MVKRVMGRPPPEWMYRVVSMKIKNDEYYTFEELAKKLDTTLIAIRTFCTTRKLPGKYELLGVRGVQKMVSIACVKKAAEETVNSYFK